MFYVVIKTNIDTKKSEVLYISNNLEKCQVKLLKNTIDKKPDQSCEDGYIINKSEDDKTINIINKTRVEEYTRYYSYFGYRYKTLTAVFEIINYDDITEDNDSDN